MAELNRHLESLSEHHDIPKVMLFIRLHLQDYILIMFAVHRLGQDKTGLVLGYPFGKEGAYLVILRGAWGVEGWI